MQATKTSGQDRKIARQPTKLDDHYGKIGISAVAAAVRHQGGQGPRRENGTGADRRN